MRNRKKGNGKEEVEEERESTEEGGKERRVEDLQYTKGRG